MHVRSIDGSDCFVGLYGGDRSLTVIKRSIQTLTHRCMRAHVHQMHHLHWGAAEA